MATGGAAARRDHHWPELDGIRAIAVLAVIVGHARIAHLTGGGIGVNVFFVLSGFLITSLLVRERDATGAISLGSFYVRRLLRIWPAAYVAIIGYGLFAFALRNSHNDAIRAQSHETLHAIPAASLFATNIWERGHPVGWFPHLWSIGVEEQFYLTWPLLCAIALSRGWSLRGLAGWTLALALESMAEKVVLWHAGSLNLDSGLPERTCDGLLLGATLALLLAAGAPRLERWLPRLFWPAAAVLLGIVVVPDWTGPGEDFRESVLWDLSVIASAIAIGAVVTTRIPVASALLTWRPMLFIGRISYATYLWHYVILVVIQYQKRVTFPTGRAGDLVYVADIVGSLLLGALSTFVVERPFLRLKARFETTAEGRLRAVREASPAPVT
jgi:peptidoglycan/LPS O-acetylase OafA/YrhL